MDGRKEVGITYHDVVCGNRRQGGSTLSEDAAFKLDDVVLGE